MFNKNNADGEWHLAFVFGEVEEGQTQPTTKINALEVICRDSLARDIKAISEYHDSLKLVQSVQLNIQQFLEAVVHYAAEFLETEEMNEEKFDLISLSFSRLLLNILSMFRSLLDHSDFSVSREFGKESEQYLAWKKIQSEQYDSIFEYRLFYKLRNYCQHLGMPPMQISFTNSMDQDGIGFRLDLMRNKLLEEKSCWNKQLIKDLESTPEKIPVIDSLHKWGECFLRISEILLNLKREAALDTAHRIVNHRSRLNLPEDIGQLCAIWIPKVNENPKKLNITMQWLPENQAQKLISGSAFEKNRRAQ
jgi:hypothetical protein